MSKPAFAAATAEWFSLFMLAAFAKSGPVAPPSRPPELARRLADERAYWGPVVKATGSKPTE